MEGLDTQVINYLFLWWEAQAFKKKACVLVILLTATLLYQAVVGEGKEPSIHVLMGHEKATSWKCDQTVLPGFPWVHVPLISCSFFYGVYFWLFLEVLLYGDFNFLFLWSQPKC